MRPARASSNNPVDAGLYRGVWRYAAGARAAMLGSMALLVGSQLVRLSVPWFADQAIDALQTHGTAGDSRRALVDIAPLRELRERQPAFAATLAGSAHEVAAWVDDAAA